MKKKEGKYSRIGVDVPTHIVVKIKILAARSGRTLKDVVSEALDEFVKTKDF